MGFIHREWFDVDVDGIGDDDDDDDDGREKTRVLLFIMGEVNSMIGSFPSYTVIRSLTKVPMY